MIAIFIFFKLGLRSGKPEAYHVGMDPYSVLNIMLYSITHETSNYDLELVKSCLLYSQIK